MPNQLIAGYERFRSGYFRQNEAQLRALAGGQSPTVALISCCDSRVSPAILFDAAPGDLFIIRNVANLVPPYESEGRYHGTSAALEFAVKALEVADIVVLGHARCGGIRALLEGAGGGDHQSFLGRWMEIAAPALTHLAATDEAVPEARQRACEREALALSLENLLTFPWLKARVEAGRLAIHGWYYDVVEGTLHRLDPRTRALEAIAGGGAEARNLKSEA